MKPLPLVLFVWVALAACQDGYPIAPTPCDDWCLATQRAGCEEDYPEGCVSECEDTGVVRVHPECEASWQALADCYLAADDAAFTCVEERSEPRREVCLERRLELQNCIAPGAEFCLEDCVRNAETCEADVLACEGNCGSPTPGCEAENEAFYTCSLAAPVYCGSPEEDTRSIEEIPCLGELAALFECAGVE